MSEVFFRGSGRWVAFTDDGHLWFRSFHKNIHFANGVFSLSRNCWMAYRHTQKLIDIKLLLPSTAHSDSAFLSHQRAGFFDGLSNDEMESLAFEIDTEKPVTLCIAQADSKPKATKLDIHENERQSMQKLIIGMAIDAYGYNPKAAKNKSTGENNGSIKAALDRLGITVDADTIRKYLNEAKDLLPSLSE